MPETSEQWRPVPGYDGWYDVSDQGRVRSWVRRGRTAYTTHARETVPRILRPIMAGRGQRYHQVNLGSSSRRYVHHLVLEAFVGRRPEGYVSCHNDDDAGNNALSNLRWDTPQSNYDDRTRNGGQSRGQRARWARERAARAA